MDQYDESQLSDVTVDYDRNAKFFDKKYMKNNAVARGIGWGVAGVGALCVILNMFGLGFWFMYVVGWPLLIIGVVILCVVLAKQVKESELTVVFESKTKQFSETCRDKLEYPDDFEDNSLVFNGCRTADGSDLRKLKSGNWINPNPEITVLYLNGKNRTLFIGVCRFSLVKEEQSAEFQEIPFADFDRSQIVSETVGGRPVSRFVLSGGEKELFTAPIADIDYYKEEFISNLIHKKDLHR